MDNNLTTNGIIFMVSAWSAIAGLTVFTMWKVFSIKPVKDDD